MIHSSVASSANLPKVPVAFGAAAQFPSSSIARPPASLREATGKDVAGIDAFLSYRAETSMFLRSNLAQHGIGMSDHAHATRFFLWEEDGVVLAIFGLTNEGFALCQAPNCRAAGYFAFADAIKGETVRGLNGPSNQISRLMVALKVAGKEFTINQVEPLLVLELAELASVQASIRAPREGDKAILTDWFYNFARETGFAGEEDAKFFAPFLALGAIVEGGIRLLIENGTPVAMAGVNAIADSRVQIGGVFVPEGMRGRGLGGIVTNALLWELRDWGASSAVLFANNTSALQCYQKLGFSHRAAYRVAMLKKTAVIGESG